VVFRHQENIMAFAGPERAVSSPGLHVLWPRVVGARRSLLDRFSVNDEAYVEFGPGLLQLLSLRLDSGFTLGAGLAPQWTVPVGAGCAAAYAVLELPAFDGVNTWAGLGTTMRWHRAGVIGETLEAYARLAKLGRTSATLPYRVYSREQGDLLVEGEFILVTVDGGAPRAFVVDPASVGVVATRSPGGPVTPAITGVHGSDLAQPTTRTDIGGDVMQPSHAESAGVKQPERWTQDAPAMTQAAEPRRPELFGLTPPSVVSRPSAAPPVKGDVWEWMFPSGLLCLLANPIGGAADPLGRRFHPHGRIFESMGVYAALTMAPGSVPQRAWVRRREPVQQNNDFGIRSEVIDGGADWSTTLHRLRQGHVEIGEVEVTVSRAPSATGK
jgi:hypothetical protein